MDLWLILILLNATRSTKIAREFTTRKLIFINSPKSFCITKRMSSRRENKKLREIKIRLTLLHYVLLCDYISDSS